MRYDRSKIVFCDTETTGLTPAIGHEVWEIAVIHWRRGYWVEETFTILPDLSKADPMALAVNKFYQRTKEFSSSQKWDDPLTTAKKLAVTFDGRHIVGAIPSFDAMFLDLFLREHRQCGTWHYHLIDVEAMCLGWMARDGAGSHDDRELPLPWKSDWMLGQVGVNPTSEYEKHTALGDAKKVKQVWTRMMD